MRHLEENQDQNEEMENTEVNEAPEEQDSTYYSEVSREDKPASEEGMNEEEEMEA